MTKEWVVRSYFFSKGSIMGDAYHGETVYAIFYHQQHLPTCDSRVDEFKGVCFLRKTDALDYVNTRPHRDWGSARRRNDVSVPGDCTELWKVIEVKVAVRWMDHARFLELKSGHRRYPISEQDIHDDLHEFPEAIAFKALREGLEVNVELLGVEYVDRLLNEIVTSGLLTKMK